MLPTVSIIILNWNGRALLAQCLPSVVQTDYPNVEIIVADNASTDDSVAWINTHFPQVRIVQHTENWGFSKGNNLAIDQAKGSYILLLNNDVEVPSDWVRPLVEAMEANPQLGAVQPKLMQFVKRDMFEYTAAAGGHLDAFGYPFTQGRLFFTMETDTGQYDTPAPLFWAGGAAILFRKTALDLCGNLDERFFMHMEEIDLCWRLQRKGWKIQSVPQSKVYHIGGASLPHGNPRKVYYNFRNSLLMLYKNLPPVLFRRTFLGRLALDSLALIRAVLMGGKGEPAAILRAYRDFFKMRNAYKTLRPDPKEKAILPNFRGSIALTYYFLGKKKFSDLAAKRFRPMI